LEADGEEYKVVEIFPNHLRNLEANGEVYKVVEIFSHVGR